VGQPVFFLPQTSSVKAGKAADQHNKNRYWPGRAVMAYTLGGDGAGDGDESDDSEDNKKELEDFLRDVLDEEKPAFSRAHCKALLEDPNFTCLDPKVPCKKVPCLAESRCLTQDLIKSMLLHELWALAGGGCEEDDGRGGRGAAEDEPRHSQWVSDDLLPRKKKLGK